MEYQLTVDDINSSLVFMYTPVTDEGVKGEPQCTMTDFVKAGIVLWPCNYPMFSIILLYSFSFLEFPLY
jgi:hypothetical protein